jgi:hypothetical protein
MSELDEFLKRDIAFKSDFVQTASGDLDVIAGLDNVKEALFRRLVTTPGSVIHRPEYGCNLKAYQGSLSNLENQRRLAQTIKEQFESDERVEVVTGVSFNVDDNKPDMIKVNVKVSIRGYGETAFTFVGLGDV